MAQQLNPVFSRQLSASQTKKIAIIGSGIVGSATGAAFLSRSLHEISFHDIVKSQLDRVSSKVSKYSHREFLATTDIKKALAEADYAMICVPTPASSKTSKDPLDYSLLDQVMDEISMSSPEDCTIVVRSTIDPIKARSLADEYGNVWYAPEFLREKTYMEDAQNPDRIVIGIPNKNSQVERNKASALFRAFKCPKYIVSLEEASFTKLVTNSFLATKISFFNEVGRIANSIPNLDPEMTAELIALDSRIGRYGIIAGKPYGGKCLPKDSKAMIKLAGDFKVLRAVDEVNENLGGAD